MSGNCNGVPMDERDETFGKGLADLYIRLRTELLLDYRGMDPIDPGRAPIAMAILELSTGNRTLGEVETAMRSLISTTGRSPRSEKYLGVEASAS